MCVYGKKEVCCDHTIKSRRHSNSQPTLGSIPSLGLFLYRCVNAHNTILCFSKKKTLLSRGVRAPHPHAFFAGFGLCLKRDCSIYSEDHLENVLKSLLLKLEAILRPREIGVEREFRYLLLAVIESENTISGITLHTRGSDAVLIAAGIRNRVSQKE